MTATRIGVATLAAAWIVLAILLWQSVPPGPHVPGLDAASLFDAETLSRNRRYGNGLRLVWALGVLAQLAAVSALVRRPSRIGGPIVVRAALTGALVFATLFLAALPLRLLSHWWRRRYDVSDLDYLRFVAGSWPVTLGELALAALAGVAVVTAGKLLGPRAWLGLWAAFCALAAVYVLVTPGLLAPRLRPLGDRALAAQIDELARQAGLEQTEVEVRKAKERTRAVNAEAIGVGPTTRVILWDTLLEPQVGKGEVRFVAAHELAHVARRHAQKGLAWFCLLGLPGAWLLARAGRLDDPRAIPRLALVLVLLQLAALPLVNAISRRYEREADRVGLELAGDPASAEALFRRFARTNLSDPQPPWALHVLLGTHPTLVERIAFSRAAGPPEGPGSP